jgi:multiple sugar transport system permease protein
VTLWILIAVTAIGSVYSLTNKRTIDGGWRAAWWFVLPSLIGFLAFFLIPTIRGVYLSFTDWNALSNSGEFIGTENYTRLWDDAQFWNSMKVTAYYVAINIGSQTILAIGIAIMMDRLTKSSTVRSIILLPWLIPNLVAGLLALWLLDPNLGVVNDMLGWIGLGPYNFFTSTSGVIWTVAGLNTWKFMGYTALLIFAGLQTIPANLYEAAALDGASEWQMMKNITIPLMRPVLALVMVVTVVGSFQVFDTVQVATGGFNGTPGGPVNRSRVIYLYIYQTAFKFFEQGFASAMAVVLLIVLMAVTALQMRLFRANESDLAS